MVLVQFLFLVLLSVIGIPLQPMQNLFVEKYKKSMKQTWRPAI